MSKTKAKVLESYENLQITYKNYGMWFVSFDYKKERGGEIVQEIEVEFTIGGNLASSKLEHLERDELGNYLHFEAIGFKPSKQFKQSLLNTLIRLQEEVVIPHELNVLNNLGKITYIDGIYDEEEYTFVMTFEFEDIIYHALIVYDIINKSFRMSELKRSDGLNTTPPCALWRDYIFQYFIEDIRSFEAVRFQCFGFRNSYKTTLFQDLFLKRKLIEAPYE